MIIHILILGSFTLPYSLSICSNKTILSIVTDKALHRKLV